MLPRRRIHVLERELGSAFGAVLRPSAFGPGLVADFEREFAAAVGAPRAWAVSSGRAGMEMLLSALGLEPGSEVIVPAYTLKALLPLIGSLGLVPVVADVEPDTFNVSARTVAPRITAKTRAIMPAHIFGSPADIDEITALARERGIYVVEDCAHSAGASICGRACGALADAAFFSFETIKPINTYGGGMVVVSNPELAARFGKIHVSRLARATDGGVPLKKILSAYLERVLLPTPLAFPPLYLLASPRWRARVFSLYRKSQNSVIQQFAYTGFQAALGMKKLARLDAWTSARRERAERLKQLLPDWVVPQKIAEGARPNYYFFVCRVGGGRDAAGLRRRLLLRGIDAGVGAEIADDCSGSDYAAFPGIGRVFAHAVHLPLNEKMNDSAIRRVAAALEAADR